MGNDHVGRDEIDGHSKRRLLWGCRLSGRRLGRLGWCRLLRVRHGRQQERERPGQEELTGCAHAHKYTQSRPGSRTRRSKVKGQRSKVRAKGKVKLIFDTLIRENEREIQIS